MANGHQARSADSLREYVLGSGVVQVLGEQASAFVKLTPPSRCSLFIVSEQRDGALGGLQTPAPLEPTPHTRVCTPCGVSPSVDNRPKVDGRMLRSASRRITRFLGVVLVGQTSCGSQELSRY